MAICGLTSKVSWSGFERLFSGFLVLAGTTAAIALTILFGLWGLLPLGLCYWVAFFLLLVRPLLPSSHVSLSQLRLDMNGCNNNNYNRLASQSGDHSSTAAMGKLEQIAPTPLTMKKWQTPNIATPIIIIIILSRVAAAHQAALLIIEMKCCDYRDDDEDEEKQRKKNKISV